MARETLDTLRAKYLSACDTLNKSEQYKRQYPTDWSVIEWRFKRSRDLYELALLKARKAGLPR